VSEGITIKLRQPIERRSAITGEVVERIPTIVLRPPLLGDLVRALDASGGGKEVGTLTLHLAAICSGHGVRDIEGLGLEDGMEVFAAMTGFMPAGLPTGTSGSPSSPASSASPTIGGAGGQPS
jgi:hypothetical protein